MKLYKRLIQPRVATEVLRRWLEDGSYDSVFGGSFELEGIKDWFPEDKKESLIKTYEHMCKENPRKKLIFKEKFVEINNNRVADLEDLKLAIAGWYYAEDSEWCGEGSAWDDNDIKRIMEKYNLTKEDIINATPKEWIT